MELTKSDLQNIGHTMFQENGLLTIVCDIRTSNIEEILLREILKKFGDYYISDTVEYECECCGEISIGFKTNLSWNIYMTLGD